MILITGGTGFIGKALIRHLTDQGYPVRILLRPSKESPRLPLGVPMEVAVSSLNNERDLRAAMKGVDTVFHLAGSERQSIHADINGVDVEGTRTLTAAAASAGVRRLIFLSHLNSDRASAFPILKAKGLAEQAIQESGVPYTIIRTAPVFGPGDQFTTSFANLIRSTPGVFLMPGDGSATLQPIWIEDLITCMMMLLEDPNSENQLYQLGGMEFLTIEEVVKTVMKVTGMRRLIIPIPPAYLRILALFLEERGRHFPISVYWLDYLATDRTCAVDVLPRTFGMLPMRLHQSLDYLKQPPARSKLKLRFWKHG